MMTDSLNTQTMSRRSFAKQAAGIAIASEASMPALASSSQVDAELLSLVAEHNRLFEACYALNDPLALACDEYRKRPQPAESAVLKWRPDTDHAYGIPKPMRLDNFYSPIDLDNLRPFKPMRHVEIPIRTSDHSIIPPGEPIGVLGIDHEHLVRRVLWPEAQVRVNEIIAALETMKAERDAARQETGITAIEDEQSRRFDQCFALSDRIASMPATSLQGAVAKAKAVAAFYGNGPIKLGESLEEQLAASIVRDLLAMASVNDLSASNTAAA